LHPRVYIGKAVDSQSKAAARMNDWKNVFATSNSNALNACKSVSASNRASKVKMHKMNNHEKHGKYFRHRHPLDRNGKQRKQHCWFIKKTRGRI
jgi:hypothetical protein